MENLKHKLGQFKSNFSGNIFRPGWFQRFLLLLMTTVLISGSSRHKLVYSAEEMIKSEHFSEAKYNHIHEEEKRLQQMMIDFSVACKMAINDIENEGITRLHTQGTSMKIHLMMSEIDALYEIVKKNKDKISHHDYERIVKLKQELDAIRKLLDDNFFQYKFEDALNHYVHNHVLNGKSIGRSGILKDFEFEYLGYKYKFRLISYYSYDSHGHRLKVPKKYWNQFELGPYGTLGFHDYSVANDLRAELYLLPS